MASCKSALTPPPHHHHPPPTPTPTPPVVYSTDRSRAVVPVLLLLFFALWFILRGDMFMSYLVSFCSCDVSPFSIAITSLGEEKANLSVFRTFVRFVLVWICRFPLPLGVWKGLRFVIVTLPGLFSYLLFRSRHRPYVSRAVMNTRSCPLCVRIWLRSYVNREAENSRS